MANRTKEAVLCQVDSELKQLQSSDGLPFQRLLAPERILAALQRTNVQFRERIYTPMVTLWAFLSQVISKRESSCQDTVSRVLADRVARGQKPCSANNSSYCQARMRLPGDAVRNLALEIGQELHRESPTKWLWKDRHVVIVDGSTASMPDTEKNQAKYPQHKNQKPGVGFPMLRFVTLLSLSVGTVLQCAMSACQGKNTGELSLWRKLWDALKPGDIVLGDRLYDSFRDIALLKARGVDVVFGMKQSRQYDFRRGRRLGQDDHVVLWQKPRFDKTRFKDKEEWNSLPAELEMREARITVRRKGFKTRTVVIVTTLTDEKQYEGEELTNLFAERWHCELDLRSIKRAMGMHHLRCMTPDMVEKEFWTYLLAYNLVRVRMAQAAAVHDVLPRKLSFTAAKNHIHNFAPHLSASTGADRDRIETALLKAIAEGKVGNRPGRKEPRAVKKRDQKHPHLKTSRSLARKRLAA